MPLLTPVQKWSAKMDQLFGDKIDDKIKNDARTEIQGENRKPFGYDYSHVQKYILKNGRADFSKGYDLDYHPDLSAEDKVLLYCSFNMRGHYHSSRKHFHDFKHWLNGTFLTGAPVLVDIGCGPGTSALAFGDVFPNIPFSYIGSIVPNLCAIKLDLCFSWPSAEVFFLLIARAILMKTGIRSQYPQRVLLCSTSPFSLLLI